MYKHILFLLIGISLAAAVQAQIIPNGFSFQAVARDASGNIAPNRVVYIQADVLKGATNAVSVYSELHQVTTTAEGIFSIIVGEGSQPSTNFSNIVWSDDTYSLKVKIAVTPVNPPVNWTYQNAFIDAGTVQLLSVPYAKVAGNGVDTSKIFFLRDTTKILGNYLSVNRNVIPLLKEKLNIADSITGYVTPTQLKNAGGGASAWYDTTQMLSGYMRKNNAVTSISIDSANGISGTVKNPYSTPVLSLSLKDITPLSVKSPFGSFNKLNTDSVSASGITGTLATALQPNITSLGVLSSLSVSGILSAGTLSGTLSPQILSSITSLGNLSSITVTNNISTHSFNAVTGSLTNLSVPGTLTATNATISNLSGLSTLTLTGAIAANTISVSSGVIGNLSVPGSITGGSFNGALNGTIVQPNQPNITSIGQLSNLNVTGTAQAGVLSATTLNVSQLGGLLNLSVANTIEAASLKGTIIQSSQPNITSIGQLSNLSVTGTVQAGILSATTLNVSQLGGLSNLSVANTLEAASLKGTIIQSSQPNITSVGQLSNLSVTGTAQAGVLSATTLNVSQLGGLSNLSVANTLEAVSLKGTIIQSSQPNITSIGQLSNLSVTGTAQAGVLSATTLNVSQLGGLSNLSVANMLEAASLKGTITEASQPNITSIGQLSNLSVTGTVQAGVLSATTLNVSQLGGLSNLSVANTIEAASLKGTITEASQPNITSIGQLSNLSVTGTVQAGVLSATTLNVSQLGGLSNLSVANTLEAVSLKGTIIQSSQPNITSIGQLSNLSVTGTGVATTFSATNASFSNISGLNLITGTVSDDVVTISNGVLRKKAAETFAADFVVTGTSFLKWADGETVPAAGKTAIQLLQEGAVKAIHPTYNNPSVSINASPSGGNVEIGSNISVTLGSTFTQNDAGAATTTTYRKNGTGMGSNTDNVTNITSAISYTVNVAYGQGACKNDNLGNLDCTGRINAGSVTSSAITYTPMARRYWGYASSTSPNDANIIAVLGGGAEFSNSKAKSSFTITPPGTANYIFFAYPASLGTLTSIIAGGFESIGAFTLTTRTFVNASGYSQSYHIYVSNNTFSSAVTGITTN